MSKCDLDIHLANSDRRYQAGEEIAGEVRVSVDADCRCKALTLSCRWRTHGRGNKAKGEPQEQVLFQGEWRGGERARYPFKLRAPNGPATYRGSHLNIDWYLEARADIPWALDPKAETDFLLEVEDTRGRGYNPGPRFKPPKLLQKAHARGSAITPFVGVIVIIVGVLIGVGMLSDGDAGFSLIFPALFSGIGLLLIVAGLWNRLAQRKLGKPFVQLDNWTPAPGEALHVQVGIEPSSTVKLNAIWIKLVGWEEVVRGSGSNRTTYRQTLHDESIAADIGSPMVQARERRRTKTSLHIPADAPFSFDARDNHLKWSVEVHIDVEAWPDWRDTLAIAVLPKGARTGAAAD